MTMMPNKLVAAALFKLTWIATRAIRRIDFWTIQPSDWNWREEDSLRNPDFQLADIRSDTIRIELDAAVDSATLQVFPSQRVLGKDIEPKITNCTPELREILDWELLTRHDVFGSSYDIIDFLGRATDAIVRYGTYYWRLEWNTETATHEFPLKRISWLAPRPVRSKGNRLQFIDRDYWNGEQIVRNRVLDLSTDDLFILKWKHTDGIPVGQSPLDSCRDEVGVIIEADRHQRAWMESIASRGGTFRQQRTRRVGVIKGIERRRTAGARIRAALVGFPDFNEPITDYFAAFWSVRQFKTAGAIREHILREFSIQVLRPIALKLGFDEWPCLRYDIGKPDDELDELFSLFTSKVITEWELAHLIRA
jgi:hypothetical protein